MEHRYTDITLALAQKSLVTPALVQSIFFQQCDELKKIVHTLTVIVLTRTTILSIDALFQNIGNALAQGSATA